MMNIHIIIINIDGARNGDKRTRLTPQPQLRPTKSSVRIAFKFCHNLILYMKVGKKRRATVYTSIIYETMELRITHLHVLMWSDSLGSIVGSTERIFSNSNQQNVYSLHCIIFYIETRCSQNSTKVMRFTRMSCNQMKKAKKETECVINIDLVSFFHWRLSLLRLISMLKANVGNGMDCNKWNS